MKFLILPSEYSLSSIYLPMRDVSVLSIYTANSKTVGIVFVRNHFILECLWKIGTKEMFCVDKVANILIFYLHIIIRC